MRCSAKNCGEELEKINTKVDAGGGVVYLSDTGPATLYACTSADCVACGVVLVTPHTTPEEREAEEEINDSSYE